MAHCMEARDWRALHENLRAGQEIVNRIHLPCYDETTGKKYLRMFEFFSMNIRTLAPSEAYIYPELENGSFTTFTKDPRFLRFQLESSIPLLPVGMTYDIYDFVGNGTTGISQNNATVLFYLDKTTVFQNAHCTADAGLGVTHMLADVDGTDVAVLLK